VEDQAQNSNNQRASNAEVHTPKTAKSSAATSAAIVTTIFNVLVGTAWRPLHSFLSATQAPNSIRTIEDWRLNSASSVSSNE
jgi:cytoskeletal protein RodZ